jgi:hypothetical protein
MIVYEWAPEKARYRSDQIIHRAEGEPNPDVLSDAAAMRSGTFNRTCDGTRVQQEHIKQRLIRLAPAGLEVCPACFKGHLDELIPLYRTIPTGVGQGGTDE